MLLPLAVLQLHLHLDVAAGSQSLEVLRTEVRPSLRRRGPFPDLFGQVARRY